MIDPTALLSLLAAGTAPAFFTELAILVVAGALIAYICHRLGLVPIVGFLISGVLIGPHCLRFVTDRELVDAAAEVGVILLLFTIGIEFSLEKLARIKSLIFGGGGLQVGLATLVTCGALGFFGVPWKAGLFTGFLVALSSTAIVLKLLGERGETDAPHGRIGLGLLIFQDLAIIVMVLLVPILGADPGSMGGGSMGTIGLALAKAAGIVVLVLVVARRLMPPLLERVARTCSPELFLLTLVAICFGTAYLTYLAGVSLSLGAFLAGLLVSESHFSEQALGEILPLQILFSATFFISVGMLLDLRFLVTNLPLVCGVIVFVLAIKLLTTTVSVAVLGYPRKLALASGLLLAQVGEFSFVLERAGREIGLFPAAMSEKGSQAFIAATVVLMVATPFLAKLGTALLRRSPTQGATADDDTPAPVPEDLPQLSDHVVVSGYGNSARRLVPRLVEAKIPFLIVTLSPTAANEAESLGYPIVRADSTRQYTQLLVGLDRAKLLIIADDDPVTTQRIAAVARTVNPTLCIVVRTRYLTEIESLQEAGVDRVIAEELESVVQLFGTVLRNYDLGAEEVARQQGKLRREGYAALRRPPGEAVDPEAPVIDCELDDDCLHVRRVTVRKGSPLASQTAKSLALGEDYLLTLRAIERSGGGRDERILDPQVAQRTKLRPGDELILAGAAVSFQRAAHLFRHRGLSEQEQRSMSDAYERLRRDIDVHETIRLHLTAGDPASIDLSATGCSHLDQVRPVQPSAPGCELCLAHGAQWVHTRICMTCGFVGCCDSSPGRHARAHFEETGHPIICSLEPGETWAWCYHEEVLLENLR